MASDGAGTFGEPVQKVCLFFNAMHPLVTPPTKAPVAAPDKAPRLALFNMSSSSPPASEVIPAPEIAPPTAPPAAPAIAPPQKPPKLPSAPATAPPVYIDAAQDTAPTAHPPTTLQTLSQPLRPFLSAIV